MVVVWQVVSVFYIVETRHALSVQSRLVVSLIDRSYLP